MSKLMRILPVCAACLLLAACGSQNDKESQTSESTTTVKKSSSSKTSSSSEEPSAAAFKDKTLDTGKMTFHITKAELNRETDDDDDEQDVDQELVLHITITNDSDHTMRPANEFAAYSKFTQVRNGDAVNLEYSDDDGDADNDFDDHDDDDDVSENSAEKLEDAWSNALPAGKSVQATCTVELVNDQPVSAVFSRPSDGHVIGKHTFSFE